MERNGWMLDIQGSVATLGARDCIKLWLAVSSTHHNTNVEDRFLWPWTGSGAYTTSSTYNLMAQGSIMFELAEAIWESRATPKSKFFVWLAAHHRIWTSDRRARHGLQATSSPCFVCLQKEDTAEHILVRCVYAREGWFSCRERLGAQFEIPEEGSSIQDWWTRERRRFSQKERCWFDGFVCTVSHALWKQRNAWCFHNAQQQFSVATLTTRILEEFRMIRAVHGQEVGVLDNG
jgi:hypothetical protein